MFDFPNRYVCGVLDEMRSCDKTKNYAPMLSLIEEVQIMANRMEAALDDSKDYKRMIEDKKDLKAELKKLRKQISKAKRKI